MHTAHPHPPSQTRPAPDAGRYSAVDTAIVARRDAERAATRAARVAEDCVAEARRVRRALATHLGATLRRTRGLGHCDALVLAQLAGVHRDAYWTILGAETGETVPRGAAARAKIVAMARDIAAGRIS
jgi:hypothetical protein